MRPSHISFQKFFPKGNPLWPVDDEQSLVLWVVYESIHVWRMPAFFLLAGFFCPPSVGTSYYTSVHQKQDWTHCSPPDHLLADHDGYRSGRMGVRMDN